MALIALIFGLACIILWPVQSDGKTRTYMLDIGQGDSFLIVAPNGKKLLIDGGRNASVLTELSKVMPRGDKTIDVMIATHPDADHIGGLPSVLDRYQIGLFLTSDVSTDTKTFTALFASLLDHQVPAYYARHGMALGLAPNTTFSIIFPDRPTTNWDTNPASVVGRLDVGPRGNGVSTLFTGDSTSSVEHYLATAIPDELNVDILKLGHHGSKYSSSTEYLTVTSPSLGLISAGVNNSYGHPSTDTLARLKALNIPWTSTQDHGIVTITTDGTSWHESDEK